jgi:hypothetical protein
VVTIRATYEHKPAGSAGALAEEVGAGLATVVSEEGGRASVEAVVEALATRSAPARPA